LTGILFDTTVYINAFRSGDLAVFSMRTWPRPESRENLPVWLSAVVLEELYAGTGDEKARKVVANLEDSFAKVNRLLVPLQSDWTATGKVLNKIGQKYGFEQIGKGRLTNDTLLAMTVARNGMSLLTGNSKDFELIAEFKNLSWKRI
jgi:predicted nucleic acid-binding protein